MKPRGSKASAVHGSLYAGQIMGLLKLLLQRLLILGLGILTIWLIAYVFEFTDRRLPTLLALAVTYGIAAYFILPRAVRTGLKILQRKRVPRFTITGSSQPRAYRHAPTASGRICNRRLVGS